MRDVTSYLGRDPARRLADAAWEDPEEETAEARLERIQAEPRNKHHLDRGGSCSCEDCRAGRETTAPAPDASHRPCGDRSPGGLRCNHLVRRAEDGKNWRPHQGPHGAFTRGGDYVQW